MSQHEGAEAPVPEATDDLVVDLTKAQAAPSAPAWSPAAALVCLGDWFDTEHVPARPELLQVDGSMGLFYVGKSNSLAAPPGRGKTLLVQLLCLQEAVMGRDTVFIDYEKDLTTFLGRMKALGLSREQAEHCWYWRPDSSLAALVPVLLAQHAARPIDTVIIDSVGGALERMGPHANENDNSCVRAWYRSSVDPLVCQGLSVVMVDHLRRADADAGGDVRSAPKGAMAKLEVITGSAWSMRSGQPFSQDQAGVVQLSCTKDNNGGWAERAEVTCHVTPDDGGKRISVELRPGGTLLPPRRPTGAIDKVLAALRSSNEPMSRSALKAATGLKDADVKQAVEVLIGEGAVEDLDGPRGARLTKLVDPPQEQLPLPLDES